MFEVYVSKEKDVYIINMVKKRGERERRGE